MLPLFNELKLNQKAFSREHLMRQGAEKQASQEVLIAC